MTRESKAKEHKAEAAAWVGQGRFLKTKGPQGDLHFPVEIVDAYWKFGRVYIQIKPYRGKGLRWIELRRTEPILPVGPR